MEIHDFYAEFTLRALGLLCIASSRTLLHARCPVALDCSIDYSPGATGDPFALDICMAWV